MAHAPGTGRRSRTLSPVRPTRSSDPGRDAWPSYSAYAVQGYVIYGLGAITPYLRTQLGLSDAQVGLHPTGMAIGIVFAGAFAAGLDRRFGELAVRGAAIAALAVAVGAIAVAPAFAVTLGAAVVLGLGLGTMLGYANAILARPGGRLARVRVARANLWAMAAAFVCPLVLSFAAFTSLPWALGLAPALLLLVVVGLDLRAGPRLERSPAAARSDGRLSRGYWLAWTFIVAAVAVEFSIVFWGATLIGRRTGVDTAAATLLGGMFVGGMFVGRLAQSLGLGTHGGVRRPAAIGLALAIVGASVAWASTAPVLSGAGLFVAGLGVAGLYPLGVAAALGAAPGQLAHAGTRLTLASGMAILAAPLALGVIADSSGVVVGWALVVGLAIVALVLAAALPDGGPTEGDVAGFDDTGSVGPVVLGPG